MGEQPAIDEEIYEHGELVEREDLHEDYGTLKFLLILWGGINLTVDIKLFFARMSKHDLSLALDYLVTFCSCRVETNF
jgi:hypothetical protein